MADNATLAFAHLSDGMNSALDPALLAPTQAAKLINVRIDRQLATTRSGARVFPVTGDLDWRTGNLQGAKFYDPSKGQGTQVFADDSASVIIASAGRKYRFFPDVANGTTQDITGEDDDGLPLEQQASALLIWLEQAENYVISGDDNGSTWIFDSANARYSTGFVGIGTEEERNLSEIPHGIRCPIYAHGRLWVVQNARRIFGSDSIHGENQTLASDLLRFVEQVYWATGQYFVPPSSMGNIIAAAILPTRDVSTGQGEIMYHCVNGGIFSINGNVFPRDLWSSTPMVSHFLLDTAASGPYALDLQEGDQLFRSRAGIQTLRSARAESRLIGRPLKPISEEVGVWLDEDHVPYLRYASLINFPQEERMFCTVNPVVVGLHRYHKGIVSMNWDALDSGQAKPAWEGLWTFPKGIQYVSQMVRGMFADNERVFGIHFDGTQYSMVEYDEKLKADVLEDGTEVAIQSRVVTRELQGIDPYIPISVENGTLFLRDVCRDTTWKVYARTDEDECWILWKSGSICMDKCDPSDCNFSPAQGRNYPIELGALPDAASLHKSRRWQFLIEWTGWARIEALRVRFSQPRDDDAFVPENLLLCDQTKLQCCTLTDFDYST